MPEHASAKERVMDALNEVIDPELGIGVVDLGLIYSVEAEGRGVKVRMTLTTPMCPLAPVIIEGVRKAAEGVEGVEGVDVEVVFDPPWSPEKMSPSAREKLGLGI